MASGRGGDARRAPDRARDAHRAVADRDRLHRADGVGARLLRERHEPESFVRATLLRLVVAHEPRARHLAEPSEQRRELGLHDVVRHAADEDDAVDGVGIRGGVVGSGVHGRGARRVRSDPTIARQSSLFVRGIRAFRPAERARRGVADAQNVVRTRRRDRDVGRGDRLGVGRRRAVATCAIRGDGGVEARRASVCDPTRKNTFCLDTSD